MLFSFLHSPHLFGHESWVAGLLVRTEVSVLQIPTDFFLSSYRKRNKWLKRPSSQPVARDQKGPGKNEESFFPGPFFHSSFNLATASSYRATTSGSGSLSIRLTMTMARQDRMNPGMIS